MTDTQMERPRGVTFTYRFTKSRGKLRRYSEILWITVPFSTRMDAVRGMIYERHGGMDAGMISDLRVTTLHTMWINKATLRMFWWVAIIGVNNAEHQVCILWFRNKTETRVVGSQHFGTRKVL